MWHVAVTPAHHDRGILLESSGGTSSPHWSCPPLPSKASREQNEHRRLKQQPRGPSPGRTRLPGASGASENPAGDRSARSPSDPNWPGIGQRAGVGRASRGARTVEETQVGAVIPQGVSGWWGTASGREKHGQPGAEELRGRAELGGGRSRAGVRAGAPRRSCCGKGASGQRAGPQDPVSVHQLLGQHPGAVGKLRKWPPGAAWETPGHSEPGLTESGCGWAGAAETGRGWLSRQWAAPPGLNPPAPGPGCVSRTVPPPSPPLNPLLA